MYDYHILFAGLGIMFEIIAMSWYFRSIVRGTTKPHAFTWFAWAIINCIVAAAQIVSGAGIGALVTVAVALGCFIASVLAFLWGEQHMTRSDCVCFVSSLVAIGLWTVTKNALFAVVIVSIADALAFIPTYRKAWRKPLEETAVTWSVGILRGICTVVALRSLRLVNWLYPLSLICTDAAFLLLLIVRRRELGSAPASVTMTSNE